MVTPQQLAKAMDLTVICADGHERVHYIYDADLCRPGLQFAGYFGVFANERPQIVGRTEMAYLNSLTEDVRIQRLSEYFSYDIPCIIIARGMECPWVLREQAMMHGVPVYGTQDETSIFSAKCITYLSEALAPKETCHGVLMDVFGVGMLIMGASGIGKSECALELLKRGHQLVADDVVDVSRVGGKLIGESPEMIRDFMELRGIGIIDVKLIFGIGAVLRQKRIDMVICMELLKQDKDYDRLGNSDKKMNILGLDVPMLEMPVLPGRNLAIIVEIAARNWRLRSEGYNAVAELDRRLAERYGSKRTEQEEYL